MSAELKTTTEALEINKEELQSVNETLLAVNEELKRKVEALSQANNDLQNLIESTDVGTIFLDRTLRIKRFTPRVTDLFVIADADIGRPLARIAHHLDHPPLPQEARQVLNTLETIEKVVQSDNKRWYIMRLFPYRTVAGAVDGVVITFVDITDLRRAEHEQKQRVQQQVVAELGRLALAQLDLDTLLRIVAERVTHTLEVEFCKVLELTPAGDRLLLKNGVGWRPGLVGRVYISADHGSQAGYALTVKGPVVVESSATERRFSDSDLLIDHQVVSGISVVIPGLDKPYGVLAAHSRQQRTYTDYDAAFLESVANLLGEAIERRQAELALHLAEQQQVELLALLESMLANAPIGFAFFDREHRYVRINETLAEINGISVDDHIGHRIRELLPINALLVEPIIDQVFTSGEAIRNLEIAGETPAKPGLIRHWLTAFYPVSTHNEPIYVGAVVVEITDHKNYEAALKSLNENLEMRVAERTAELKSANEELDRFAYIASHDLKAPLRAIDNLATWITEDAGDLLPKASREHLAKLRGRVTRLEKLLDDLLTYSRVGRRGSPIEQTSVATLIHDILYLLSPPQNFVITVQPDMPTLSTSPVPLQMVFRNLIANAIKHHDQAEGRIDISARDEGEHFEFRVSDNGPGIPEEFHQRAFEMFQTLQPRDQTEGSGMGLAVVKKIVESYGGQIRIDSGPGRGATFRFTWPKLLSDKAPG